MKIFCRLLIGFLIGFSFELSAKVSLSENLLSIEKKLDGLDLLVKALEKTQDSARVKNSLIEEKINLYEKISERQSSQLNLGLAMVSILITLVGLLLPIVTYLTSIRPGIQVVEEAKKTLASLEQKFSELSHKQLQQQINDAIQNLSSTNISVRNGGMGFLFLIPKSALGERELKDICFIAESADAFFKSQLLSLLAGRDFDFITGFFRRQISQGISPNYVPQMVSQCNFDGARELKGDLKRWATEEPDNIQRIAGILSTAISQAPDFCFELINDEHLINSFSRSNRLMLFQILKNMASTFGSTVQIENSFLERSCASPA